MTNVAMLREVEERMNGELILFPVHFTKSKELFGEADKLQLAIDILTKEKVRVEAEANARLEEEYMRDEEYRQAHIFLSAKYGNGDVGNGIHNHLEYRNAKPLLDHEGRWFRTVKDACEYHGVLLNTFYLRRKQGRTLAECLSAGRLKYRKRG